MIQILLSILDLGIDIACGLLSLILFIIEGSKFCTYQKTDLNRTSFIAGCIKFIH